MSKVIWQKDHIADFSSLANANGFVRPWPLSDTWFL